MKKREIYEVYANIVDANGSYNALSGYPKTFDSKNYSDDLDKTRQRAYGEWHNALATMAKVDTRQIQLAGIIQVSTGMQIALERMGELADLPESEPETEE